MSRGTITEVGDVEIATIPFHFSFQQLIDSFHSSNGDRIAQVVSRVQERAVSVEERALLTLGERKALRRMNLSADEIGASREEFLSANTKPLRRRAEAWPPFGGSSTSPACPGSNWLLP